MLILAAGGILSLSTCTRDFYTPDACFREDVLPIFVSNCSMSGCHNPTDREEGYDLTTYEGIMKGIKPNHPLQSEIFTTIKGSHPSMPPSPYPKLGRENLNTIKMWIEIGAPNSSNCRTCDTVNFTYSGRISGLFQTWCVGCHNSGNAGGGFDLSSYNGVINAIPNNKLLGSIKHLAGFSSMPKNSGQIPQCEIDAVENWINAGYPNN